MEEKVKHRINGFSGTVTGVAIRPSYIDYQVLPIIDSSAKWVDAIWIDERYLEADDDKPHNGF